MHLFLGFSKTKLATFFHKDRTTISDWINKYNLGGGVARADGERVDKKYSAAKRQWLVDLYSRTPVLYLDEAKSAFDIQFNTSISRSYISVSFY
jgi:transposase